MTGQPHDDDWAFTLLQEIIDRDNRENNVTPEAMKHVKEAWRIMMKRRSRARVLRGRSLKLE